jgi:hypothetical protein
MSRYPKGSGKWAWRRGAWAKGGASNGPGGWHIEQRSPACFVLTRISNSAMRHVVMSIGTTLEGAQEAHARLVNGEA